MLRPQYPQELPLLYPRRNNSELERERKSSVKKKEVKVSRIVRIKEGKEDRERKEYVFFYIFIF